MSEQTIDRYLAELSEWLRIPSISADPKYAGDVQRAAQWLADHFAKLGGTEITVHPTKGHPIVTARFGRDANKPTVLVYGHYDVQPPDPLDLWTTPAFDPQVRDGKLYARGASDDKGQVFMHLKAVEELKGDLPCNIVFLIEGEEECGSDNLVPFIEAHRDILKCDAILISDTGIIDSNTPSLTVGLRGLAYTEVTVTSANRDLHSGVYGGNVGNPISALTKMIAALHDENNYITIPGFYDGVRDYTDAERAEINRAPFDEAKLKQEIGIKALQGEKGYTALERTGIRPCLDVNGIWGGYTGEGAKTVLPAQAHAKISMRLVPGQDHEKVATQLIDYLRSITPTNMIFEGCALHGGPPAITRTDSAAYKAAHNAMKAVWSKDPVPMYEGASIPIVADLNRLLNAEVVLMGFALNSDAIHSPNEHFVISHIPQGIATIMEFYKQFAK